MMVCALCPVRSFGHELAPADTVDNDFVIASLLLADPGNVLYSTVGHVALRMQCPMHNLDYVFSYESEDVQHKVLTFISGNLKMGMFAVPFDEYLNVYKEEHRGVQEYELNLPLSVKRNLWRVCDEHMLQGPYLQYDYLERGCAHSALMMIKEGLGNTPICYEAWPNTFEKCSRKELAKLQVMPNHPWTWFLLNLISNGTINRTCSNEDKTINVGSGWTSSIWSRAVILTLLLHSCNTLNGMKNRKKNTYNEKLSYNY